MFFSVFLAAFYCEINYIYYPLDMIGLGSQGQGLQEAKQWRRQTFPPGVSDPRQITKPPLKGAWSGSRDPLARHVAGTRAVNFYTSILY